MSATPSFPGLANSGVFGVVLTTAATSRSGASSTLLWTAGVAGAWFGAVNALPIGTNASATALRVFLENGSGTYSLIAEQTVPVATTSEVAGQQVTQILINRRVEAGDRIYVSIGTTIAAGLAVTAANCWDF